MKKQLKQYILMLLVALAVIAAAAAAIAAGRSHTTTTGKPEVKVSLAAQVERDKAVDIEKAGQLVPGEVLTWTITSVNSGSAAAQNYKTVGDIPAGTIFVANSTNGAGKPAVSYSIDGGKTFDTQPMISQKQPDGSTRRIPAPVSLYTQVRFEWMEPLAEGKALTATYQVRVK